MIKMTDDDIFKSLEYCATFNDGDCDECQYGDGGCRAELIVDAFALVNHLKAKNKELDEKLIIHRGTIDWQAKEINRQKAEIERLRENNQKLYEEMAERQKEEVAIAKRMGKAEAIKEILRLVIRRLDKKTPIPADLINMLYDIKKEMDETNDGDEVRCVECGNLMLSDCCGCRKGIKRSVEQKQQIKQRHL